MKSAANCSCDFVSQTPRITPENLSFLLSQWYVGKVFQMCINLFQLSLLNGGTCMGDFQFDKYLQYLSSLSSLPRFGLSAIFVNNFWTILFQLARIASERLFFYSISICWSMKLLLFIQLLLWHKNFASSVQSMSYFENWNLSHGESAQHSCSEKFI